MDWRAELALWRLLPLDPYRVLELAPDADDAAIRQACERLSDQFTRSWGRRAWAQLCGQSPARLRLARDELLDPAMRAEHDRHQALLMRCFRYPPQG